MADKPHISATQLLMLAKCPEQYRRRYIEGDRRPPGIAMLVGSGFHTGAETNFRQKIESHEDLPARDIVDSAVEGFKARLAGDGLAITDDEAGIGQKLVIGEATDLTAQLADAHARMQAPDYQPVAVEQTTRILLPNATHDLLGVTDMRDDKDRVVDLKTAARKPPANAADVSLQLTIYGAATKAETGRDPSEVRLDTITKTKTPARYVNTRSWTVGDLQALVNRLDVALKVIANGDFAPCDPGHWACSPKWCGYYRDCKYVNSERS